MKVFLLLTLTITIASPTLFARTPGNSASAARAGRVKRKMKPFRSERELARYFAALAEKHRRAEARRTANARREALQDARRALKDNIVTIRQPEAAPLNAVEVQTSAETITNTQHAGVDEGDIVKVHGNHLVVLRRGRLFTIAIDDRELKPVAAIDAFGPDMNPSGSWYDEMLVSENTIVVIGYSYQRGGTEVGLFDINNEGQLAYRSTYHLSSGDYYSSRNYASRLIGNQLIFYAPQYVNLNDEDPIQSLPAVRKWHEGAKEGEFHRIVPANRVYRPEANFNPEKGMNFHTITICDLANRGFDCQGTTVLGPPGRVFYVSPSSVYVWASAWNSAKNALLFRMPLDGSGPSALRVSGSPVDQFSFLESGRRLTVLVRSESKGEGMWAAEVAAGDVALMSIPIASFSDGSEFVPAHRYRQLEKPEGDTFQNRFVANYLIYGTGSGWGNPKNIAQTNLFVANWKDGNSYTLSLPHGVDRIEQLGADAVIVGTDGKNLHFSSVRLGQVPELVSRYVREEASQGELRSHGFFYKPDNDNSGTLGLPISVPGRSGYKFLTEDSAAILFLRNDALQFREVGELASQPESAVDDECRASCVDWYGNARPLFLRGRVFALLGYELVEGTLDYGRMQELRRINYAPAAK